MADFKDGYDYVITDNTNGTFSRTESDGLHIFTGTQDQALANFSSLQPIGYVQPAAVVVPVTTITPAQLLARLTQTEALAIQTAALSNAQVALWLTNLSLNTTVTSTDATFIQGLAAFVSAGLLTAQRAAVISDFGQVSP